MLPNFPTLQTAQWNNGSHAVKYDKWQHHMIMMIIVLIYIACTRRYTSPKLAASMDITIHN